jgi:hypothetical protein
MKLSVVLSSLTALFFAVTAAAEGVSINPGQWEMTVTMTMSMMPTPKTTTVTECVKEEELNPENFNPDEDNPCAISNLDINDDRASWSIVCPTGGGPIMKGQWEFTSSGDSITGNGSMSTNYGGQEMNFAMDWQGKRTGDCQ